MVDITKDEFWEVDYELKKQKERRTYLTKGFIKKHKIMILALAALMFFMSVNIVLIYNFFKIIQTL